MAQASFLARNEKYADDETAQRLIEEERFEIVEEHVGICDCGYPTKGSTHTYACPSVTMIIRFDSGETMRVPEWFVMKF